MGTGDLAGKTSIGPKNLSKVVDASDRILKGVWVRASKSPEKAHLVDPLDAVVKIVKRASETVVLYSPKMTHAELSVALEDLRRSNVGVYALTPNIEYYQKIFQWGLMREHGGIASTLVLVDPKGNGLRSIWFGGELTSQQGKVPFILELDAVQTRQAWAHFSHLFWTARGKELFLGRQQDALQIRPKPPAVNASLSSVLRGDAIGNSLRGRHLEELWVSRSTSASFSQRPAEIDMLVCEVCEDSRRVLATWRGGRVRGGRPLGVSMAKAESIALVFRDDLGFVLTEGQQRRLREAFPTWEWVYEPEVRIADLRGPVLRPEDNWETAQTSDVRDQAEVPIANVPSRSLPDWKQDLPDPRWPEDSSLALRVRYTWSLVPPAVPGDAKKDDLYRSWTRFDEVFRERLKRLREGFESYRPEGVGGGLRGLLGQRKEDWSKLFSDLESLEKPDWSRSKNRAALLHALDQLDLLESKIADYSKKLVHMRKEDEIEAVTPVENPPRRDGEKPTTSKEQTTRVDLRDLLPDHPAPSVGSLWQHARSRYLAIQFVEEIDRGMEEAKVYDAKLVWSGSEPGKGES